jgi:hypothetical protein
MHTCYSLCTNEVLNIGFSNHNLLTRLLHLKGVSQLNKWVRELKWMSGRSIYTPFTQIQPLCANSEFFVLTGRVRSMATVDFRFKLRWVTGLIAESGQGWPDTSCHLKSSLEPLCSIFMANRTHCSRVRSVVHRVRLQTLARLTADCTTCTSGQVLISVRSLELMLLPSNTLTERVRSSKGPRPVKQ